MKNKKQKLSKKDDMLLFDIEQDARDLEEALFDKGDKVNAEKAQKIAERLKNMQNG